MIPREEAVKIAQACHFLDKRMGIFRCPICTEGDDMDVCCAYCTMYNTPECTSDAPCRKLKEKGGEITWQRI